MQELLFTLAEYIVAFIIIFIILFLVIAFLFTKNKFPDTIKGFFLVLASFIYSPFVYFKNSLMSIADFRLRGADNDQTTKQFLLNRFLTSLQALLAIIVIIIITSGIITAWEILLPPKDLREQNDMLEARLSEINEQFRIVNPDVEKMEKDWNEKKLELIDNYKKENENIRNKALKENENIEQKLNNNPAAAQFFNSINNYLSQNEYQYNVDGYERIKNEVIGYIDRQDLTTDVKNTMRTYSENWYITMIKQYEKNNFGDEQYREKIQPDYISKSTTARNLSEQSTDIQNQLGNLKPALRYKFGESILALLSTFITVIVIIWVIGLILELLWLSVDIANNVNKIKQQKEINKQ